MNGSTQKSGPDQRQSLRVPAQGFVECAGPGTTVHRELADIGTGGMFIDSHPTPFQPGERLKLRFDLSRDDARMGVDAEVLYVQDGIGMGVRFIDLGEREHERIAGHLSRAKAESRGALRKSSRVFVRVPVEVRIPAEREGDLEAAHIVTLSKYGACLETSQAVDLGTRVYISTKSGLEFRGNVVWIGRAGVDTQAGIQCRGLAQALGFRFP
jgi:hypothetical protein